MKHAKSHGLTGMLVALGGALGVLGIAVTVFELQALQTQWHTIRPRIHNVSVRIHADAAFAQIHGFFPIAPFHAASMTSKRNTTVRFADVALRRVIAQAPHARIWAALLYNGNQQDRVIERVARLSTSSPSRVFEIPTLKNSVDAIAGSRDGAWFTSSAADLIGHVLRDGTVIEYPASCKGARPASPAVAASGSVWFAETAIGRIANLDQRTGRITEYPENRRLDSVGQIAIDGNRIWFTEPTSAKIGYLNSKTGLVVEFRLASSKAAPTVIAAAPGSDIWFIDAEDGAIGYADTRAEHIVEFVQPKPLAPKCLVADANDSVWFCTDAGLAHLDRLKKKTTVTLLPQKFNAREAIPVGGRIWFVSQGGIGSTADGAVVRRYVPDYLIPYTGKPTMSDVNAFIEKHPNFRGGYSDNGQTVQVDWDVSGDLAFGHLSTSGDGTFWLVTDDGRLGWFSADSDTAYKFVGLEPQSFVYAAVSDRQGRVWLAEQNRLLRFDSSGTVDRIIYQSPPGIPNDMLVAADGSLWLALPGMIAHIQSDGRTTRFKVPGSGPFGMTLGKDDNSLWFTETNYIGRLDVGPEKISRYVLPSGALPIAVLSRPEGIWFSDARGYIGRLRSAGGIQTWAVPTRNAVPFSLAASPAGDIWFTEFLASKIGVVDHNRFRIREYRIPWSPSFPTAIGVSNDRRVWFSDTSGSVGWLPESGAINQITVPTPQPRGG